MKGMASTDSVALRQDMALVMAESSGFARLLMLLFGAMGYGLLEVIWRGHTHWSMLLAGGICLLALDHMDRNCGGLSEGGRVWCAALLITAVELVFGVVFNIVLGADVWDYTSVPYNFCGQICLPYFLIWVGLAAVLVRLVRWLRRAF